MSELDTDRSYAVEGKTARTPSFSSLKSGLSAKRLTDSLASVITQVVDMNSRYSIPIAFILVVIAVQISNAQTSCPELVSQALSQIGTDCANLDRNNACYGFNSVTATFSQQAAGNFFNQAGDRVGLTTLADIRTSPMNTALSQWGVGIMNVQANVPNALPGQGVVFVLLGDVRVQNDVPEEDMVSLPEQPPTVVTIRGTSLRFGPAADANPISVVSARTALPANGVSPDGNWVRVEFQQQFAWVQKNALDTSVDISGLPLITGQSQVPMQSFLFRTGLGNPECVNAPPSVLLVQGPQNFTARITANGAHIYIGSTILLRTLPNNLMQVVSLNGEAILDANTANQMVLPAGTAATAPLDANGMISGPWRSRSVVSENELDSFKAIEEIPENLLNYPIAIPTIILPSGVGNPCPLVEVLGQISCVASALLTPFPEPPLAYGVPGQDLPGFDWQPLEIGPAVCPNWTAFHSDRDGSWDIYRLGPSLFSNDISDNLSQGTGSGDIQPSRSADGKWVAFTSDRAGNDNWEVWLGRTDGREQYRVTFNTAVDINPAWGPGNLLTFESNRDGNWNLYLFDVSNGETSRLTDDPASDINAFWVPDGQNIVFQSDRDGDWEIYELNLSTSDLQQLTRNAAQNQDPVISPDGKKMAWLHENSFRVYDLWMMDLGSGNVQQVTDLGVDVRNPVFSPDNSFIAFDSQYDGDYDIFAVDLATGDIKNVTNNTAEDRAPTFRCNTSDVIYQSNSPILSDGSHQWDIFEVNPLPIDTNGPFNTPVNLTNALSAEFYPENTPATEDASRDGLIPRGDS